MKIEQDHAEIMAGVRHGLTLGSPFALWIENRDWVNWTVKMAVEPVEAETERVTRMRPGHADLPGAMKYDFDDVRNVLERASARETAARVAVGAVAKRLLGEFGVQFHSHTLSIGGVRSNAPTAVDWDAVEQDPVRSGDPDSRRGDGGGHRRRQARRRYLGGEIEVRVSAFRSASAATCTGTASSMVASPRRSAASTRSKGRLRRRLRCTCSVVRKSTMSSSRWSNGAVSPGGTRPTTMAESRAGSAPARRSSSRRAVKPIPTLAHPLPSVDLETGEEVLAHYERSDVCVVPAAGVVAEAMVAIVLADAWLEKFGGDSLAETRANVERYLTANMPPRARRE